MFLDLKLCDMLTKYKAIVLKVETSTNLASKTNIELDGGIMQFP